MKKISVIMPVYLGDYPNAATLREYKFARAINSFLQQTYENKELIIISDGCDIAEEIYNVNYSKHDNIVFEKIEKQPTFSGAVRNKGLELATGNYICYLDSDDFIAEQHLEVIIERFSDNDWIYWDDFLIIQYKNLSTYIAQKRINVVQSCRIGTSSIAHKSELDAVWGDDYGHDWRFIKQLQKYKYSKIENTGYIVCHQPKLRDL